jgi:L-threonylcarbamoyladenylate synthase
LRRSGIGVLLTDTIYGLVGQALSSRAVTRIYRVKGRSPKKPSIILISSVLDLSQFGIRPDKKTRQFLKRVWPGKVSVILPCQNKKFRYLHRGLNALAFRLPAKQSLRALLRSTGPLIAPSANPEGFPPARNITEARAYFGSNVDFYMQGGKPARKPSRLISLSSGGPKVVRR